jgi:hypothetical protein
MIANAEFARAFNELQEMRHIYPDEDRWAEVNGIDPAAFDAFADKLAGFLRQVLDVDSDAAAVDAIESLVGTMLKTGFQFGWRCAQIAAEQEGS